MGHPAFGSESSYIPHLRSEMWGTQIRIPFGMTNKLEQATAKANAGALHFPLRYAQGSVGMTISIGFTAVAIVEG